MRYFLYCFLCLFLPAIAFAQFTGIDSKNFPMIRAYGGGTIFANAKTSDFMVTENGLPMTNNMSVECSTAVNDPSVSVVLVIDISESMNERMSNGRTKLEWMKNGAKNFINSLVFNGTTQCAIITFNGISYILSDFQNTARPLIEAIDGIQYGLGATNYEYPLIDPQKSAVALLKNTPSWVRRAVVFLTDGTPNQDPPKASIINQLNQLKATLYAIALSFDASPDLREIAEKTGGTTNIANTEDLLVNIYKDLGNKRPTTTYCWLSYTAPFGCTEASRNRNVQINYRPTNLRQNFTYSAPTNSVASIQLSQAVLPPFPDIAPGQQATQQITITARNADMTITADNSTLPANFRVSDWGGSVPPFILKAGTSRVITIRFTQTNPRDIRSGRLRLLGNPCNSDYVSLSGGAKKVVIVSPNGGETLSSCDSILITWGGVDASDTVRLQYSMNNGTTWNLLSNSATGLSHTWRPPSNGQYLFRIAARTTRTGGMANIHGAGTGSEAGNGIAANAQSSSYAVTGHYEKQLSINGQQISSTRAQDMFLGRFRDNNVLWLRTGAQFFTSFLPYTNASGKAVLVDSNDAIYTASELTRSVNGGRISIILQKITTSGSIDWSKEILASQKSIGARSIGRDSLGNYYLSGLYDGQFSVPMKTGGSATITAVGQRPFTLTFNNRGEFLALKDSISKGYLHFPADTAKDSIGTMYTVRTFANTLTLPDTSFKSAGKQDIAIRLNGRIMTPPDQSDGASTVITPLLTLKQSTVTIPSIQVGESVDHVVTDYLCNRSSTPIILDESIITNANGLSILEPVAGTVIPGDTCLQVTYRFTPSAKGQQNGLVRFGNTCTFTTGTIRTEAFSLGASISNLDWNIKRIKTVNRNVIQLRNTGDDDLLVQSISLSNGMSFTLANSPASPFLLKGNSTLDITCDFIPVDTIAYKDSVIIKIDQLKEPLIGLLVGKGGLPIFSSQGFAFQATAVNTTSTEVAEIKAENRSMSMPLHISDISLSMNEGDFFIMQSDQLPVDLSGNAMHATKIGFKPIKAGNRIAYLKFTHDGIAGPDEKPRVQDSILIEGIGISKGLVIDTVLHIGTILTCDIAVKDLIITNPNDQDIRIIDITISDLPGNAFASAFYTKSAPIIVPAKGNALLPIGFVPDRIGQVNALLKCTAEDGTVYSTFLIGDGITMPSTLTINDQATQSIALIPGTKSYFDITLYTQKALTYPRIDSVLFDVKYPNVLFTLDSVSSLQAKWNASIISNDPLTGKASILAYSQTSIKEFPSGSLIRLHATNYLGDPANQQMNIQSKVNAICIDSSKAQAGFTLDAVCFAQGRLISVMKDAFVIGVSDKELTFSMPFTGLSEAYIVDISGRIISLLPLHERMSGNHHAMLPDVSQGVYMIIAKNGPYQIQKQIIIHNTSILH
ncbi:MAG: vWA domain-containing protein [Ignavibacteria bacterium]